MPIRFDVKARLIGYVVIIALSGWNGLGVSRVTRRRIRKELQVHGLDVDKMAL